METIRDINTNIEEGRFLMAAIAILTTTSRTMNTPDEVLKEIQAMKKIIYGGE